MTTGKIVRRLLDGEQIDPYLAWAEATAFRAYTLPDASECVGVAIECKSSVAAFLARATALKLRLSVPGIYQGTSDTDPVGPCRSSFCTAMVHKDSLDAVIAIVKRLELGTAIAMNPQASQNTDPAYVMTAPLDPIASPRRPAVVIGIVDDFIGFGDARLADPDGRPRTSFIWSQDEKVPQSRSDLWKDRPRLVYGYELSTVTTEPTLDELRHAYPTVMPRATHGSHVCHLAAGNPKVPLPEAPEVQVIGVHMPRRTLRDSSGGSLNVQALDAVRYVLHRAPATAHVVVNLSYGTMAGPHDGSSILEAALTELIDLAMGRLTVVVPVGNAYEARCHARFRLDSAVRTRTLRWQVPPDCFTPSFMEIWLGDGAGAHVGVTVTDPLGRSVRIPVGGAPAAAFDDSASPELASFGVLFPRKAANGEVGTMILVAVAPTTAFRHAKVARHGVWTVEICGDGQLVDVHVWIERDDTVHGQPRRGRQSYFLDECYEKFGNRPEPPADSGASPLSRGGSYNTIATGPSTIVVGGYVGIQGTSLDPARFVTAPYSGAGPLRPGGLEGPDVLACTEELSTLHGIRSAAIGGADTVRMNGTSVAAPQVTRLVAKWGADHSRMSLQDLRDNLAIAALRPSNSREQPTGPPVNPDPRRGSGPLPYRPEAVAHVARRGRGQRLKIPPDAVNG